MAAGWDNQGTNPPAFYSLCYVTSSELRVQPADHCSGPTSAQEDALKLITDVRFGHRVVVALQAIHPSLPETKSKPNQSGSFPLCLSVVRVASGFILLPLLLFLTQFRLSQAAGALPCPWLTRIPTKLLQPLGGPAPPAPSATATSLHTRALFITRSILTVH